MFNFATPCPETCGQSGHKFRNFYDMNKYCSLVFVLAAFAAISVNPQQTLAQEPQKGPDIAEMAAKKAEELERTLKLEYWQVFYVDSTLQHDYLAMQTEMEKFQKAKVSNVSMYMDVQDRWMETIDSTFRTIFNEDQWKAYLKSGAEKQQKARAKRRAKAEKSLEK